MTWDTCVLGIHFYGGSKVRLQDVTTTTCFPLRTFWLLVRPLRSEAWTSGGGRCSNDEHTRRQDTLHSAGGFSKGLSAHSSSARDSDLRPTSTFLVSSTLGPVSLSPSVHHLLSCHRTPKTTKAHFHPCSFIIRGTSWDEGLTSTGTPKSCSSLCPEPSWDLKP